MTGQTSLSSGGGKPGKSPAKKPVAKTTVKKNLATTKTAGLAQVRQQQILARATATFGTPERAREWLNRRSAPLKNRTPLSVVKSQAGLALVEQLLGRIDHGIAA